MRKLTFCKKNGSHIFPAVFSANISPDVKLFADSQIFSIQESSKTLDLFKDLQNYVLAQKFKDAIKKLDVESNKSYSERAKLAADEASKHLGDAMDTYFVAEQSVYEWCGVTAGRLQSYLRLLQSFSKTKARLQHRIIIQMLDEGLMKFSLANEKLEPVASSFTKAAENVGSLIAQLNADFSGKSDNITKEIQRLSQAQTCVFWVCWNTAPTGEVDKLKKELKNHLDVIKHYDEELKYAIDKAVAQINKTRAQLKIEVGAINDLKAKAQVTLDTIKDLVELDQLAEVIQNKIKIPVEKLIADATKYRDHHTAESESFHA